MNFQVLFGAIAITVSENYDKYMNFTYPISVQSYNMLVPRPKELSRLYLFIAPFTIDVIHITYYIFAINECVTWFRELI